MGLLMVFFFLFFSLPVLPKVSRAPHHGIQFPVLTTCTGRHQLPLASCFSVSLASSSPCFPLPNLYLNVRSCFYLRTLMHMALPAFRRSLCLPWKSLPSMVPSPHPPPVLDLQSVPLGFVLLRDDLCPSSPESPPVLASGPLNFLWYRHPLAPTF